MKVKILQELAEEGFINPSHVGPVVSGLQREDDGQGSQLPRIDPRLAQNASDAAVGTRAANQEKAVNPSASDADVMPQPGGIPADLKSTMDLFRKSLDFSLDLVAPHLERLRALDNAEVQAFIQQYDAVAGTKANPETAPAATDPKPLTAAPVVDPTVQPSAVGFVNPTVTGNRSVFNATPVAPVAQ